ncbi:MAG: hypothetical protein ACYSX0_19335 [Planctomycetota bacterium]
MSRYVLLCLLLATACGDRGPISDQPLQVTVGREEVEFGEGFALTVVRTWSREQAPATWSDDLLAPLSVRLLETSRREDDRRIEETRHYLAYAFTFGALALPLSGNPLTVKRALDPDAAGPAELPGEPFPAPTPWYLWPLGGLLALALLALLIRRRRRPLPAPVAAPPAEAPPGPHLRAIERIERLRAADPQSHEEFQSYYLEASGLMREYIAERFQLATAEKTTEEILAALSPGASRPEVLRECDLVKFARERPAARERTGMLDRAESFVRETTGQ